MSGKGRLWLLMCPSCGAGIEDDLKGRETAFCPYCGSQFSVDDGANRTTMSICLLSKFIFRLTTHENLTDFVKNLHRTNHIPYPNRITLSSKYDANHRRSGINLSYSWYLSISKARNNDEMTMIQALKGSIWHEIGHEIFKKIFKEQYHLRKTNCSVKKLLRASEEVFCDLHALKYGFLGDTQLCISTLRWKEKNKQGKSFFFRAIHKGLFRVY